MLAFLDQSLALDPRPKSVGLLLTLALDGKAFRPCTPHWVQGGSPAGSGAEPQPARNSVNLWSAVNTLRGCEHTESI